MAHRTIGKSLVLCFGSLLVILLLLGGLGYYSLSQSDQSINTLSQKRMPASKYLWTIKDCVSQIALAQEGLLNSELGPAQRQQRYEAVQEARGRYKAAMERYEGLPHTSAELEL